MLLLISSQLHRPGTQRRNLTNRSRGLMARRSGLRVESAADSHGMARYTHTKSRYLESKSRCRSKLSEPGPRAARRGAARRLSANPRVANEPEIVPLLCGWTLRLELAGSTCSCRTNVLAFWSGRVRARGRGRG